MRGQPVTCSEWDGDECQTEHRGLRSRLPAFFLVVLHDSENCERERSPEEVVSLVRAPTGHDDGTNSRAGRMLG